MKEPEEPEFNKLLEAVDQLHQVNYAEDEAIQALERRVHPDILGGQVLHQLNSGGIQNLEMLKNDVGDAW